MRAKASHLFAAGIVIAVALFFAIGALFGGGKGKAAGADKPRAKDAPLVQAPVFEQALRPYAVVVRGRTQANRTVQVKSQTSGVVAETPILQGGAVGAGAVLCRLAVDARQASLDQARATLRSVQLTPVDSSCMNDFTIYPVRSLCSLVLSRCECDSKMSYIMVRHRLPIISR